MALTTKIAKLINYLAASIALYAALFYWTRGWIGFSLKSIPWIIYSLSPYIAFSGLSTKLLNDSTTNSRVILFFIVSLVMLLITAYSYLQFTDESLVFYLRQMLFLLPIISTLSLLILIGVGSLLTRS